MTIRDHGQLARVDRRQKRHTSASGCTPAPPHDLWGLERTRWPGGLRGIQLP